MPPTVRPLVVTADLERLRRFCTSLLGTAEHVRYPEEGPLFHVGLRAGDSHLGLSADTGVQPGVPGRVLLSIEVGDVEALLPRVRELGGEAPGPAHDMPWGQRVAHLEDPDGNVVNLTHTL